MWGLLDTLASSSLTRGFPPRACQTVPTILLTDTSELRSQTARNRQFRRKSSRPARVSLSRCNLRWSSQRLL